MSSGYYKPKHDSNDWVERNHPMNDRTMHSGSFLKQVEKSKEIFNYGPKSEANNVPKEYSEPWKKGFALSEDYRPSIHNQKQGLYSEKNIFNHHSQEKNFQKYGKMGPSSWAHSEKVAKQHPGQEPWVEQESSNVADGKMLFDGSDNGHEDYSGHMASFAFPIKNDENSEHVRDNWNDWREEKGKIHI